jgi:hypothetical protein
MRVLGTLSLLMALTAGCGDDSGVTPRTDAGPSSRLDSGTPGTDAGSTGGTDAGPVIRADAGPPADAARPDAGMVSMGTGATGEPCAAGGDCAGGTCLEMFAAGPITIEFPGGYCSATCTEGSDTCGEGAECVNAILAVTCLRTCTTDADCRADEGYMCQEVPSLGGGGAGGTYCLPMLPI